MSLRWMLYCFSIFLVQLTTITEPKVSTACASQSTCITAHHLNCRESEYVNITGGSYGYKQDCTAHITQTVCPSDEMTRCCEEDDSDCFISFNSFNISDLQHSCINASMCSSPRRTSLDNTQCGKRLVNTYSKIEYNCINRGTTSTATTTEKLNASLSMSSTDGGDNTGGIIGAVVATIVIVATIVVVVVIVIMKRKKKQSAQENPLNERKGSTCPIINNIEGERETNGYSEVDLGDMSTSQIKTLSNNTEKPNQVTESTTYAEYNHLGDNNSVKNKPSNANYNQIQIKKSGEDNYQHFQNPGKPKPQTDAEYNHIGAVNNMVDEGDYNILGNISKPEVVDNDNYSHIGEVQRDVPNSDYDLSNYSHIGEVQRDVANNVPDLGGAGIQDGQQGPSDVRRNDYAQVNKKIK